jgi:methyl-accepting chemotaxis protein
MLPWKKCLILKLRSSLIWKIILPVPIALVVRPFGLWLFLPQQIEANAHAEAVRAGVQMANQYKVIRSYYTKNVISKVKASGALKPSINHKTEAGSCTATCDDDP